jgi:ATP phosphoribosyltransferase
MAVPESWAQVQTVGNLESHALSLGRPLRVATQFPVLTGRFLSGHGINHTIIAAEGTLEVAPAIGYADVIADLISSGQTLRDNRLRPLRDGVIITSEAALIANLEALQSRPEVLSIARQLLELIEAHLRAIGYVAIFANVRGESPEAIARRLFEQTSLGGLQGPTVSRMIVRDGNPNWHAIHIVVRRDALFQAVDELRAIGGSGVVVSPVAYIFEEEPDRCKGMVRAVQEGA